MRRDYIRNHKDLFWCRKKRTLMLSFHQMRLQSRNDIGALGSGLLGLTGLSLLLFPPSSQTGLQGTAERDRILLGILFFTLSLAAQIILVIPTRARVVWVIRATCSLVLLYLSFLSMRSGLYPQ